MCSIFGGSPVPVHDDEAHAAVAGTLLGLLHREALVDEHALANEKDHKIGLLYVYHLRCKRAKFNEG